MWIYSQELRTSRNTMEEDLIETAIGRFGKYQTWILILISVGRLPTEFQLGNVVFIIPSVEYTCTDANANNATNNCPCENPEYETSTIVSSVTSEWDLICDRQYLASLAQSMMQVGILAGSIVFGYISDRYGRKTVVLISLILEVVFVALSALVPEFWMFLVCRFFIGANVGGTMLACYILLIELSGKSFRPYMIGLQEISFVLAYITLPIIAYFVREWRDLQLITSVPWVLVIVYYWLIPESPRWLITVGKKKEAIEVLTHIAKKNNRPTDDIEAIVTKIESLNENPQQTVTYLDLFRTPKIRVYTMITAFIWMFCSHTFFGLNQYIGRLQGNIYLNVMLSGACLAPGLVLVVIATLHLKRKVSIICTFSTAGLSLLLFILIPSDIRAASLAFAIIGLIGAYTSFILSYLFTSEVFPTVIRNTAIGFASVFARLGGFIAPFVVNIGIDWVSILIFSGIAFSAAILCYFLPETKGIVLPNTIEQMEQSDLSKSRSEIST